MPALRTMPSVVQPDSRARPGRPDSAFGQQLGGGLRPNEFAGAPPTGEAGWGRHWVSEQHDPS